jgi:hypothetical protein
MDARLLEIRPSRDLSFQPPRATSASFICKERSAGSIDATTSALVRSRLPFRVESARITTLYIRRRAICL